MYYSIHTKIDYVSKTMSLTAYEVVEKAFHVVKLVS